MILNKDHEPGKTIRPNTQVKGTLKIPIGGDAVKNDISEEEFLLMSRIDYIAVTLKILLTKLLSLYISIDNTNVNWEELNKIIEKILEQDVITT